MTDGYDAQDIEYEMRKAQLEPFIIDVKKALDYLDVACEEVGADYYELVKRIIEGEV